MVMAERTAGEPVDRVLAETSIVAGSGYRYAVRISAGSEDDYLPLATYYYARVLYDLARIRSVRSLPERVDRLAGLVAPSSADLFTLAGVRGSLTSVVDEPIGSVKVALRSRGYRSFELDGEIHLTGRPLAYSMFAVLQAILNRVPPDGMNMILTALANMNASYSLTHRYADPRSQREVPAIACMAAAFC